MRAHPMTAEPSYTILQFCEAERISRSLLYRAWREGWGPRYHLVGAHKRISPEARREWRQEREAAVMNLVTRDD
jgi:hypothetical protein